jgi:hypothetical protein
MSEMEVEGDIGDIDPNDVNVDDSDDVRGISGRLKALQSVTVFVQVGFNKEQLSSRNKCSSLNYFDYIIHSVSR